MTQIAIVEMIYVAKSGRQYRAKHVEARVGFELDDLAQRAKSDLSLGDYAIQFTNVNGHQQFLMPRDLETVIVNVLAIREERWEEPAYDELQKAWSARITAPYDEPQAKAPEPVPAPDAERVRATCTALMATRAKPKPETTPVDIPNGETTQSIKITWGAKPKPPQQRVSWCTGPIESDPERTQPMTVLKASEVGMSLDEATRLVQAVASGGSVASGSH